MAEYINSKWRSKYAKKGICDFDLNYNFYFKWLLDKVMNAVIIEGGDDDFARTVNKSYTKMNLILDGMICFTDFENKGGETGNHLYACVGNIGTEPDEYYVPVGYTIANPILGSKTVYWRDFKGYKQNGVLVFNNAIDKYSAGLQGFECGLFGLIHQTATLLADNIVSINCCQINTRVQTLFTADSEAQQVAAENILKELYAGVPFKVLRQDLVKKITITPTANASTAQSITELVELHNYIVANFYQSIGIVSNNTQKRERLINAEIEEQNASVNLSLTELLESWTRGFNEVNDFYGTDFKVRLNPVITETLLSIIKGQDTSDMGVDDIGGTSLNNVQEVGNPTPAVTDGNGEEQEPETETEAEDVTAVGASDESAETDTVNSEDILEEQAEVIEELADYLVGDSQTGTEGGVVEDAED